MSYFEKTIVESINKTVQVDVIKQYKLGVFQSGYANHPKPRKADLFLKTSTIYGCNRDTIIEVQGEQHYDQTSARFITRNAYNWKNEFYDLVLRDRWEEQLLESQDILLIRILPPPFKGNTEDWKADINALSLKFSTPGFLTWVIQEAHKRNAHGVEIDWLGVPTFYNKRRLKTPKLSIDK